MPTLGSLSAYETSVRMAASRGDVSMPRHAKNPHELLFAIGLKGMNFTNNCLSTGVSLVMPVDILFGKIFFALFFRISLFNQMSIIVTYWRGCTINGPMGRSESDRSFYNPFRTDFIRDVAISQRGDMGRAHHKTSVDPLRILPTFNSPRPCLRPTRCTRKTVR